MEFYQGEIVLYHKKGEEPVRLQVMCKVQAYIQMWSRTLTYVPCFKVDTGTAKWAYYPSRTLTKVRELDQEWIDYDQEEP